MKLLHTSDWHLGASDRDKSFYEDQKYFVDRICELVREENIDAVMIAGDVFDRAVSSAEALKLYDYAMTRLCLEQRKTVAVIAGNHDGAERLSSCNDLLKAAGLYIAGALEAEPNKVSLPDTDIYLLPWITEEKVRSVFPEDGEEIKSIEDAYRVAAEHIRASFDPKKKHILLSHAFITDSETSESDRAAVIGFATQVSASVFEGFDYVALGHIHKPQSVTGNIRYSGTPMPYSFGKEEKQEKSVTVIDTETMSQKVIPLPLLHKRSTLTGTLQELLNPSCPEEIREGYVKIQVTDQYAGLEVKAELGSVYKNILDISGKSYDGEDGTVSISAEDLERMEDDPVKVFRIFCEESMGKEADDHLTELFREAVQESEENEE